MAAAKQNTQGAQDAHEAVRPSSVLRTPDEMKKYLDKDQLKLYTLFGRALLLVK